MKQIIITALLLCFFCSAKAQFSLATGIGVNSSTCSVENSPIHDNPQRRWGYNFSILPKYQLGVIALGMNMQYSLEGFNSNHQGNRPGFQSGLQLNKYHYLRLNPQVEWRFHKHVGVYGGVSLGANVLDKIKWESDTEWNPGRAGFVEMLDFGLVGGIRAYYGPLYITAGYYHGLQNISALSYFDLSGAPVSTIKQTNSHIHMGFGILFGG